MWHYIYSMQSTDPDPTGGPGTVQGWFDYYKRDNGPDVFVTFAPEAFEDEELPADGGLIWFSMNNILIGVARITEVRRDQINKRVEAVYDSDKIASFVTAGPDWTLRMGKVTDAVLAAWYDTAASSLLTDG